MERRTLLAGLAGLPLATPALAQSSYPDRPLTMVIAFPAGGGTDVAARPLARIMEKYLGQAVVITNRPGASGEIGFTELARAKPDGYTIGFINTPTIVTIPIERPATRFRLDDFSPVLNIVDDPGAIWVLPDSPIRTVADLVAEAKRRPGQVSYGTSGIGSDDHLAVLALERVSGDQVPAHPLRRRRPGADGDPLEADRPGGDQYRRGDRRFPPGAVPADRPDGHGALAGDGGCADLPRTGLRRGRGFHARPRGAGRAAAAGAGPHRGCRAQARRRIRNGRRWRRSWRCRSASSARTSTGPSWWR